MSKSLYAKDPDGIEFEVMWRVPADGWPAGDHAGLEPLDLAAELDRWAGRGHRLLIRRGPGSRELFTHAVTR